MVTVRSFETFGSALEGCSKRGKNVSCVGKDRATNGFCASSVRVQVVVRKRSRKGKSVFLIFQ